jgi:hypothetical protein
VISENFACNTSTDPAHELNRAGSMTRSDSRRSAVHSPHQLVLESIASFNSIFLEALAAAARDRPHQFPLSPVLLPEFARLNPTDCLDRGALSVCLAEARFGDPALWRPTEETGTERQDNLSEEYWAGSQEQVVLAHSLFLVAWQGAHSLSAYTQTLFGMTDNVNRLFQTTPFTRLFPLAQARATWVYPRWRERVDVWRYLIDSPAPGDARMPSPTLRLLQACATDALSLVVEDFLEAIRSDEAESARPRRSRSQKPASVATRRTR